MAERQMFLVGKGVISLGRSAIGIPLRAERAFRYGRMFKKSSFRPDSQALNELGIAMHIADVAAGEPATLRAGYTYLGQFITHDITFDRTANLADGELASAQIRQGRTPSLELDSLYGMGPLSESSRHLYESDRIKFKIGTTTPTQLGNAPDPLPNDLPRDNSGSLRPQKAMIADPRNDRNLALAQTHLAFLKFHNAVVDCLAEPEQSGKKKGLLGRELFEEARKKVIQHYQWIILNDYLRQVVDEEVLNDVLANGADGFKSLSKNERFLPVEFAFAAFRFGHCMVRDQYDWNRVFESPKKGTLDAARLHQLFTFGGANGTMQGAPTLPTNWVIDWMRFYDFSKFKGLANNPKSNLARKIGPFLSPGLKGVPGFPADVPIESRSVAVLDLHMGAILDLPTGQEVANFLGKKSKVTLLSSDQIAEGPHKNILDKSGLHEHTPLWYYILKEAEVFQKGVRLGPIGSRIVAETIVGLIQASEFSILEAKDENGEPWKPDLGQIEKTKFGMADLLAFVNDLNPLGDVAGSAKPIVSQTARARRNLNR